MSRQSAIQILLILATLAIAWRLLAGTGQRTQAVRRLGLLLLLALVAYSIIDPSNTWTNLARMLGVGRGADLILYGSPSPSSVRRDHLPAFPHDGNPIHRLARRIALDEAQRASDRTSSTGSADTLGDEALPSRARRQPMPTDPSTPRRPGHDDAYVVDTRRLPKRAAGGSMALTHGDRRETGPDRYDADVVDTRGRGRAPVPPDRPQRRGRKGRVVLIVLLVLLLAWIGFMVWVPMHAWGSVNKVDNIPGGERPTDTSGYNYLLVGSDSREGLTTEQRKKYATGDAAGNRTDTIMLVHVSESGGKPVMVSLPRDSYVPIPGHGRDKINAAYSIGGPKLLTNTVEQSTGIHVDGYVEIGLGGFAAVVDSVGGVDVCVARDMKDKKAGIDLKKGCQTLDGGNALGYVRSRYEDPLGDIGGPPVSDSSSAPS